MVLTMNKKGSAFVWVMITFMIFGIAMIYMIMTQPIIKIQEATWDQVSDDPDYAQTYNTVVLVWKYWPLVMIVGLIIIGILLSLKQEPYTGYQL
jgi:hypothetical protein